MSFDLYLQPAVPGQSLDISRSELRALFPVFDADSKPDYWSIRYDSLNSCHIGVKSAPSSNDHLASFYVERPCGDGRFWEALFLVLQRGYIVLYFPGGPPIVANEEVAAALAPDIVGSSPPRCVRSAAEILKILGES